MYSYFYRLFQSLILKRSFNEDLIKLIKQHNVQDIIDIGSADSPLLKHIGNDYSYHGYELDPYFTKKLKSKHKGNEKLNFYNQGVDDIDFERFNPDSSIIVLVGLFHHIDDTQIKRFLDKTKCIVNKKREANLLEILSRAPTPEKNLGKISKPKNIQSFGVVVREEDEHEEIQAS